MSIPEFASQGAGATLIDALTRLAAARGAKRVTAEASEGAKPLFENLGFAAQKRNLVRVGDEWLANTTMTKSLGGGGCRAAAALTGARMARERLYLFDTTLRDGALTTGVDFSLDDKRNIAGMLERLGIDYVEGGYPGANPLDTEFFQQEADEAGALLRLRHDETARPLGRQRPRRRRAARLGFGRDRLCREILGLPRARRARLHARGKSRQHRRKRQGGSRFGPRGDGRLRAFFRRLQGQSRIRARLRHDLDRGRGALGGALRHQRRRTAARGRADRGRSGARHSRRPPRHPRP